MATAGISLDYPEEQQYKTRTLIELASQMLSGNHKRAPGNFVVVSATQAQAITNVLSPTNNKNVSPKVTITPQIEEEIESDATMIDTTKTFIPSMDLNRNTYVSPTNWCRGSILLSRLITSSRMPHNLHTFTGAQHVSQPFHFNLISKPRVKNIIDLGTNFGPNRVRFHSYVDSVVMIEWEKELEFSDFYWATDPNEPINYKRWTDGLRIMGRYKSRYSPAFVTHFTTTTNLIGTKSDILMGDIDIVCVTMLPHITPENYRRGHEEYKKIIDWSDIKDPMNVNYMDKLPVDGSGESMYFKHNQNTGDFEYIGMDDPLVNSIMDSSDHSAGELSIGRTLLLADGYIRAGTIHPKYDLERKLCKPVALKFLNDPKSNPKFDEVKKIWEVWSGLAFEDE